MDKEKRELTIEELDEVSGGMKIITVKDPSNLGKLVPIPFRILSKKCPYCNKIFTTKEKLNEHIQESHPDK